MPGYHERLAFRLVANPSPLPASKLESIRIDRSTLVEKPVVN